MAEPVPGGSVIREYLYEHRAAAAVTEGALIPVPRKDRTGR
ncbi:hypothetical protein ACFVT1_30825 [Streptomyces sp. NPDC057963]